MGMPLLSALAIVAADQAVSDAEAIVQAEYAGYGFMTTDDGE